MRSVLAKVSIIAALTMGVGLAGAMERSPVACPVEKVALIAAPTPAPEKRVDDACSMAPRSVMSAPAASLLIDVRPPLLFADARIAGAANMPLDSLAGNALAKGSREMVLVGTGKDTGRLMRTCALLRSRGLRVRVLDGGMPAWRRAGGAIVGSTADLDRPLVLDERELYDVVRDPDTTLLFADGAVTPALLASGTRATSSTSKRSGAAAHMAAPVRTRGHTPTLVVFVASVDSIPLWRTAALAAAWPEPLFFVGSASRYDAYVHQQALIAAVASAPKAKACGRP